MTLSRAQVQRRKDQAARFTRDVLADPDRAAEIEAQPVEDYAAGRGFELQNPKTGPRKMASLPSQVDDLQETLDNVQSILEDAYTPEASREQLAEAVGQALDEIEPDDEEEEDAPEGEE
jgi:hypothetical protein